MRVIIVCFLCLMSVSANADVFLGFDAPIPGTIQDKNGIGTGFTHRLPRTGGSLLVNDANLDLVSVLGSLLITSTQADLNNGGFGLGNLESPTVLLSNLGTRDLTVSALVKGITLGFASDHLSLVVGNSSNETLRASIHHGNASNGADNTYVFTENWSGSSFGDDNTFNSGFFSLGDDILWSINRTSGQWSMSWENLTQPALSSSSPLRSLPWLDSSESLYFGLYHVNPNSPTQHTNQIDFFSVSVVPEPTALLLSVIGLGLLVVRRPTFSL
jgi:hypothetical protein